MHLRSILIYGNNTNYPKWRFSEKEHGRVVISVAAKVPLSGCVLSPAPPPRSFFPIIAFSIKIMITEIMHDQYCLHLDIQRHRKTKYLLMVSFVLPFFPYKTCLRNRPCQ